MTRETLPLPEAIARLADMHEAERDRIETWAAEAAPVIAARLGLPVEQVGPVLAAQIAQHLDTLGEIAAEEAAGLIAAAGPKREDDGAAISVARIMCAK